MERHVPREVAEVLLERPVELDRVHACDALGEVARQHSQPGADLEHDVVRRELGEASDHAEDVLVDQEVLAELLLRSDHSAKHSVAFASMRAASSPGSSPRVSASVRSVWTTLAGSFSRPRLGCGARYGQSVSARILSAETRAAASRSSG